MKAHKFVSNINAPQYGVIVFCELCGEIAFWANQPDNPAYCKRGTECKNGIDPETSKLEKQKGFMAGGLCDGR
jgi:hypothetical protein